MMYMRITRQNAMSRIEFAIPRNGRFRTLVEIFREFALALYERRTVHDQRNAETVDNKCDEPRMVQCLL